MSDLYMELSEQYVSELPIGGLKLTKYARERAAQLCRKFIGRDPYACEKLLKMFSEYVSMAESELFRREGIWAADHVDDDGDTEERLRRMRSALKSRIDRLYEHYRTILGASMLMRPPVHNN